LIAGLERPDRGNVFDSRDARQRTKSRPNVTSRLYFSNIRFIRI